MREIVWLLFGSIWLAFAGDQARFFLTLTWSNSFFVLWRQFNHFPFIYLPRWGHPICLFLDLNHLIISGFSLIKTNSLNFGSKIGHILSLFFYKLIIPSVYSRISAHNKCSLIYFCIISTPSRLIFTLPSFYFCISFPTSFNCAVSLKEVFNFFDHFWLFAAHKIFTTWNLPKPFT